MARGGFSLGFNPGFGPEPAVVTDYLSLPGSDGNYASAPDVNLFDADTSHGQQGDGRWTSFTNNTVVQAAPPVAPVFGTTTHKIEYRRADQLTVSTSQPTGTNGIPCSVSTQYTVSAWVYLPSSGDLAWARFRVRDYDSGGVLGSSLTQSFQAIPQDTWTLLEYTFTTAADAAYLSIFGLDFAEVGTPVAVITTDQDVYFQTCLRTGSDGTFVPSLRIVGDLDIEAKLAMDDWSPATINYIVDRGNASTYGYLLLQIGTSTYLYWDANSEVTSALAGGVSDGETAVIRVTRDASTGDVDWYLNGVVVDTDTSTPSAITDGSEALAVGGRTDGTQTLDGDLYYVTVRDGIGGPVVFRSDFTALSDTDLDASSFTTDEGHTVTLNGTGWAYPRVKTLVAGKTPELLLEASVHTEGIPMWSDRSGNNHHAQLGSAAGADTNDPLFKPYDGTRYTYLPGSNDNYISTADVNLLDADNAHCHQSAGLWSGGSAGMTVTGANDDIDGKWSTASNVLKYVEGTEGTNRLLSMNGQSGFAAATTYSMGAWVYSVDQNVKVKPFFRWMTGVATQIGSDGPTAAISVPANTWTWVSYENLTSIALTTHVGLFLRFDSLDPSGNIPVGYTAYVSGVAVYQSATASTFVPSLRIVGDLDVEWKAALDDYTAAAHQTIVDTQSSNDGYRIRHLTGGQIDVIHGNGSSSREVFSAATGATDGDTYVFRATVDVSTGAVVYYIDGVQHDTDTMATGAASPSGTDLYLGAAGAGTAQLVDGDVYYVEVRDGIDGPVVARYDAADAAEPFATQTDAETGRTWTYNRSASGLVSTVVDRNMFLLSTDDYFTVADDDALDFAADESLTVFAVVRVPDGTPSNPDSIVSKQNSNAGALGWGLYLNTANGFYFNVHDGTVLAFDVGVGAPTENTLAIAGGRRDVSADNVESFLDGVGTGSPATDGTTTTLANTLPLRIGAVANATPGAFFEGQVVAVALFREALTDEEIARVGAALIGGNVPTLMMMGVG